MFVALVEEGTGGAVPHTPPTPPGRRVEAAGARGSLACCCCAGGDSVLLSPPPLPLLVVGGGEGEMAPPLWYGVCPGVGEPRHQAAEEVWLPGCFGRGASCVRRKKKEAGACMRACVRACVWCVRRRRRRRRKRKKKLAEVRACVRV